MATRSTNAEVQKVASQIQEPSRLWCIWSALRGTNSHRLKVRDTDLHNKWIILTGGNSGIGHEAALQFARWGANIVLGCRQPPPLEIHPDVATQECRAAAKAAGHLDTTIEWWECDMADLASVEVLAKRWLATGRPLDILANNAGMGGYQGEIQETRDGFEIVHQVGIHYSDIKCFELLICPLGELPCTCSLDYVSTRVPDSSSGTSYCLHDIMYALHWHLRPDQRKGQSKRLPQQ